MEDDRIVRIEDKIDKVVDTIGVISVTLEGQHQSLTYHIKRTDLLQEQLKPIDDAYKMLKGVIKFLAAACTGVAALEAILYAINFFKHKG